MERRVTTLQSTNDPAQSAVGMEPAGAAQPDHKRGFATGRVILALMLREMTARYGRTPGGYLWAILEPIGMICVLALGFSLIMRSPALGNSFILFYASGYLVFSQYRTIEASITKSIPYTRGLLRYPVVTWLDALLARFFLNSLTGILNTILILTATMLITANNTMINFLPMMLALILASVLALGIGTLNALLTGLWPLWQTIVNILSRPLMIASAVLYIVEDLSPRAANVLWYNPLVHLTGMMRTGVYYKYPGQYISPLYVLGIAMVSLTLGLVFLHRYARKIIADD